MICLVAFVAATVVCMVFNQTVLDVLNEPLVSTVDAGNRDPIQKSAGYDQEISKVLLSNAAVFRSLAAREDDTGAKSELIDAAEENERVAKLAPAISARKPVTLGVSEPFMQTLKVSAYAGLLISLPLILFQVYAFVLPAFSPREKQVALPAMLAVPFLFVCGVVFGYYTVVPRAIEFLQNFNTDSFDILIQAQPYYKFVLMLLPGQDPITMALMMAPMYVLFEASILFSWLLDRRAGRAAAKDLDESSEPEPVTTDQD